MVSKANREENMIVCIIAEGSYPYVTGGVSSWIHQLIRSLPEIDFKILSIMPDYEKNLERRYEVPENLKEIKTIYLNDFLKKNQTHKQIKVKHLTDDNHKCLFDLITLNPKGNLYHMYQLLNDKKRFKKSIDLLKSDIFWEFSKTVYDKGFKEENFNDFFWTYRSMFISIINMFEIEAIEADVYHSVSTGYAGFLGAILKYHGEKPFILTEHGIYPREREEEILKAPWVPDKYKNLWIDYFYFISKLSYQAVDELITLFKKNQDIQLSIGAPKDKSIIIPNCIDLDALHYRPYEIRANDAYVIGAVLRITPIKDVMTLIRSFKIVKETYNEAKLIIIGPRDEDEEYYRQCLGLVELLKLKEAVTFTGRVDVVEYYRKMDVLVLTSISEGQPLVILEAMAVGLPVVSTDVGACRELLQPDQPSKASGIITPLVHPKATADGIIKILQNGKLASKFARNGRKRVEESYYQDIFINAYRELYTKNR